MAKFLLKPICCSDAGITSVETVYSGDSSRKYIDLPLLNAPDIVIGRDQNKIKHLHVSARALRVSSTVEGEFQITNLKGVLKIFRANDNVNVEEIPEGSSTVIRVHDMIELVAVERIPVLQFEETNLKLLGCLAKNPHRYLVSQSDNDRDDRPVNNPTDVSPRNPECEIGNELAPNSHVVPICMPKVVTERLDGQYSISSTPDKASVHCSGIFPLSSVIDKTKARASSFSNTLLFRVFDLFRSFRL
jgi:hypothetical protein